MDNQHKNLYLPQGYRCNPPITFDHEGSTAYWTADRIALSTSYQHHVYLLAARIIARREYRTAMDLGCGPATKAPILLNAGITKLVLVDQPSSREMVRSAMPDIEFIALDLETADLRAGIADCSGQFDLIVCADVIEHLANPFPCLDSILYHLKSSGMAIFSTPDREVLRGKHCMSSPNSDHVCEWTSKEFRELLNSRGFTIWQHYSLPPQKLSPLEEFARMALHSFIRLPRWHACQVAVCGKK